MQFFRVRLILALIASVTIVSAAFTYFDVLAHRHVLREDLIRRTTWMARTIAPDIQNALSDGDPSALPGLIGFLKSGTGALALAVYDSSGHLVTFNVPTTAAGTDAPRRSNAAQSSGTRTTRPSRSRAPPSAPPSASSASAAAARSAASRSAPRKSPATNRARAPLRLITSSAWAR